MRKLWLFLVVFSVALVGCGGDDASNDGCGSGCGDANGGGTPPAKTADVNYKCAQEGCTKTKTLTGDKPAPS